MQTMQSAPIPTELTRIDDPLMLPLEMTVREAAQQMHSRNISAVLVMDAGDVLVGIFTQRDAISRVLAARKDPDATVLGDVMTANIHTISADYTVEEALRLTEECRCRHLPIVAGRKVIGLLSRCDLRIRVP